jgi:nucleoid DNA-binding protein
VNRRQLILAMTRLGAPPERYDETLGTLAERLESASMAVIPGLGVFSASCTHRPRRSMLNPFTRKPMVTLPRWIPRVRFAPDFELFRAVEAHFAQGEVGARDPLVLAFVEGLTSRRGAVQIAGIGKFYLYKEPAQQGRVSPRTGAVGPALPARRSVRFQPAAALKARIVAGLPVP